MRNLLLFSLFSIIIIITIIPSVYSWIPPTRAYERIVTPNGTVIAKNYSAPIKFVPLSGMTITGSQASNTIFFSGPTITPAGDRFGWFAINTSPNLQNQHFYNFSTGFGISAFVGPDDFILSAVNFVNATSKTCPGGTFISAYSNTTGTFICSPSGSTFDTIQNIGNGQASVYAGNTTKLNFQFKTLNFTGSLTGINGTHSISIKGQIYQNNTGTNLGTSGIGLYSGMSGTILQFLKILCGSGLSCSSNSTNIILTSTITDTNTAQIFNADHAGQGLFGSRLNATANTIKSISAGQGITLGASNSTDVNVATNFKVDNIICSGNSKVSSFSNTTGQFTCTGGTGAIQTASNVGKGGKGFFQSVVGSTIQLRNLTSTRTDLITLSQNTTDVNISSPFKSNTITCTNQFFSAFNNSTGLFTCGSVSGFITTINGMTGPVINIHGATSLNITATNASNTITINTGTDIPTLSRPNTFNPLNRFQHGTINGNGTVHAINGMIEIDRTLSGINANMHGYSDFSIFQPNAGGSGADSYDSQLQTNGAGPFDHIRSYQSRLIHAGTGALTEESGFGVFSIAANTGAGTVTNVKEFGGVNPSGSGTKTNVYGFFMPDLTNGTNNWAIFTGLGKAHFGDNTDISGNLTAQHQVIVAGLNVAISAEKTSTYTPTITDDVIVMNASAASRTVTLPTPTGSFNGKIYTIKMVGLSTGNVVTITPTSGHSINGFNGFNMTHANEIMVLQSNGTAWNILNNAPDGSTFYQIRGSTTRWMSGAVVTAGTGTILDASSSIYSVPFIVPATEQFDKIAIEVSTASNPTTTLCRLGIYTDTGNTYPLNLVANSDVGTFQTPLGVATNTFSSPITLHPGLYWKAVACATAATAQPTFRAQSTGLPAVLGTISTGGLSQEGDMVRVTGLTFGAMPGAMPSGGTVIAVNTLTAPLIMLEMKAG